VRKRILIALVVVLALAATASLVWATSVSLTVVSDTGVMVYGPLTSYAGLDDAAWGTPNPAVATWVHGSWPSIPDATWISTALYTEDPVNDSWRWFSTTFELCAGAYNIDATVQLAATSDNAEEFYFNGSFVGSDGEVQGTFIDDWEWQTIISYPITPQEGVNTLDFIVRNYAQPGGSPTSNPTGLIYKAEITYDCPIQVDIDIKPGSDPNCFNNDGHGVIPVAILGSADFDVTSIDPATVELESLAVRMVGKSDKLLAHIEDVNNDSFDDLVVQIEDVDGIWSAGTTLATVTGALFDGTPIVGQDYVCITQ